MPLTLEHNELGTCSEKLQLFPTMVACRTEMRQPRKEDGERADKTIGVNIHAWPGEHCNNSYSFLQRRRIRKTALVTLTVGKQNSIVT